VLCSCFPSSAIVSCSVSGYGFSKRPVDPRDCIFNQLSELLVFSVDVDRTPDLPGEHFEGDGSSKQCNSTIRQPPFCTPSPLVCVPSHERMCEYLQVAVPSDLTSRGTSRKLNLLRLRSLKSYCAGLFASVLVRNIFEGSTLTQWLICLHEIVCHRGMLPRRRQFWGHLDVCRPSTRKSVNERVGRLGTVGSRVARGDR
jgi:hypothetical protein